MIFSPPSVTTRPRDVQVQDIGAQTFALRSRTWEQLKFEIEYAREKGTTANSYLIRAQKTALIDPPGASFTDIYLEALENCIPLHRVDYVIVQHVNPNRLATLKVLLAKATQARIICTKPAALALEQAMAEWSDRIQAVRDGDTLALGKDHDLKFAFIPTPRWADGLCTYDAGTQILYTDKLFGAHLCGDELWDIHWQSLESDRKYYFDCLHAMQAKQVEATVAKLTDYPARMYAPGHGPLIRYSLSRLTAIYTEWCQQQQQQDFKVILLYASAYGNTARAADAIAQGLIQSGIQVQSINCEHADPVDLATLIEDSDGIIIGSPTLGGHAPIQIQTALSTVLATASYRKLVGVFGSYGWSGEAIDFIERKLKDANFSFGFETLRIRFSPTEAVLKDCQAAGVTFATALQKHRKKRVFSKPLLVQKVDRTAQAMGRVIGSICVVTYRTATGHRSILTSWVSQATFTPPGIMLAIASERGLDDVLQPNTPFVLNLLQHGRTLRQHFFRDRVSNPTVIPTLSTECTEQGGLVLTESVAYLECRTQQRMLCGDRWLIYATVERGKVLDASGKTAIHYRVSGHEE
ncbi:Putative diflavin flavoprotein A 5 [Acaryochloris thomasi RCC1774]|uniref:Diflavin flavoprotein A 5 n=1 Tax=Acaryochloris thomasi RCC1774 TaxID=1764569 RepID=A0A2W1JM23_9CYAN|nr:diflavin flavoprotein [Acaryochloris thomasi]PZD70331.1 Putative diflavin flavoprotein A 5 [Acaryochloris thomasi RCC1774]